MMNWLRQILAWKEQVTFNGYVVELSKEIVTFQKRFNQLEQAHKSLAEKVAKMEGDGR